MDTFVNALKNVFQKMQSRKHDKILTGRIRTWRALCYYRSRDHLLQRAFSPLMEETAVKTSANISPLCFLTYFSQYLIKIVMSCTYHDLPISSKIKEVANIMKKNFVVRTTFMNLFI